jgi:hypothetical protein
MSSIDSHRIPLNGEILLTLDKKINKKGTLKYNGLMNGVASFTFTSFSNNNKQYHFSLRLSCEGKIRKAAIIDNAIFELSEILPDKSVVIRNYCTCSRSKFLNCINPF